MTFEQILEGGEGARRSGVWEKGILSGGKGESKDSEAVVSLVR